MAGVFSFGRRARKGEKCERENEGKVHMPTALCQLCPATELKTLQHMLGCEL